MLTESSGSKNYFQIVYRSKSVNISKISIAAGSSSQTGVI